MKEPGSRKVSVEREAARWLARCDRGLSPQEQDRYLEWLHADVQHAEALARARDLWLRMDMLAEWRPVHSDRVNSDLLRPAVGRSWWVHASAWAIASAALITAAMVLWPARRLDEEAVAVAAVVPAPERRTLDDGSIVELNAGAALEVAFAPDARRVRLVHGEALFTVAADPVRPFLVESGSYAVRALGTAFCVSAVDGEFSVLVTEGQVRVERAPDAPAPRDAGPPLIRALSAGHAATISRLGEPAGRERIEIREVTPAEVDAALYWRSIRLVFEDVPLHAVVAEFNRYNVRKLTIADEVTGAILVGGTFRADHLDAFVRLLDSGFEVSAVSRGEEILLQRRP